MTDTAGAWNGKARVTVDGLYYDLSPDALLELQAYLREAPQLSRALDNLPPDHAKLTHAWIINAMERRHPGVGLVGPDQPPAPLSH